MYTRTVGNIQKQSVGGWLSCDRDGDDSEFQSLNKVYIYPGKHQYWLVAAVDGANVTKFVQEYLVDPLDTSWVNENVVYSIREVAEDKIKINFQSFDRVMQPATSGKLNPPVIPKSTNIRYFIVDFIPPSDAPSVLPWPVQGCLEKPEVYLSAATTDKIVSTGQVSSNLATEAKEQVQRQNAEAAAREDAIDKEINEKYGLTDPMDTVKKYALVAIVGVGLIYLAPAIARAVVGVRAASRT